MAQRSANENVQHGDYRMMDIGDESADCYDQDSGGAWVQELKSKN